MISIPSKKKKFVQTNVSDSLGNVLKSFNLDLQKNIGNIRVSPRLVLNTGTADDSDLGLPTAFANFPLNTKIWAICGNVLFKTSDTLPSTAFAQDAISGTPTDLSPLYSDIGIFNNRMYVSGGTSGKVYKFDGASWTTLSPDPATTTTPHFFCQFGNRLYMTDNIKTIISWNTSDTVASTGNQYAIDLGGDTLTNSITSIKAGSNRIWIATLNRNYRQGAVYEWDGSSAQATRKYTLKSSGALAMIIQDDIPYIIDVDGNLQQFNGAGFTTIGTFKTDRRNFKNSNKLEAQRWIHPNGMCLIGGKINILINSEINANGSPMLENIPSGIWEYDKETGLIHRYSFAANKSGDTINQFGSSRISDAGAMIEMNVNSTDSSRNGTFLAGATYFTNASSTASGIFYDDINNTKQKAGYIVTTKIESESVSDVWQRFTLKYGKLLAATDKVVIKYRIDNPDPTEATITWSSTTQFTTTADLSGYAVGDEVEVIQGVGAGRCAHITALPAAVAGTYTVTIDETFTGATGTAKAFINKWKKLGSISDQTSQYKKLPFPPTYTSTWIEMKIWMLFTGENEVEELLLQNITSEQP